jgi:hypothetical protein
VTRINTSLAGHALSGEGRHRYTPDGTWLDCRGSDRAGCAKCECGALSPMLANPSLRKAWHRKHKDEVRGGAAQPTPQVEPGQEWEKDGRRIRVERLRLQSRHSSEATPVAVCTVIESRTGNLYGVVQIQSRRMRANGYRLVQDTNSRKEQQ